MKVYFENKVATNLTQNRYHILLKLIKLSMKKQSKNTIYQCFNKQLKNNNFNIEKFQMNICYNVLFLLFNLLHFVIKNLNHQADLCNQCVLCQVSMFVKTHRQPLHLPISRSEGYLGKQGMHFRDLLGVSIKKEHI